MLPIFSDVGPFTFLRTTQSGQLDEDIEASDFPTKPSRKPTAMRHNLLRKMKTGRRLFADHLLSRISQRTFRTLIEDGDEPLGVRGNNGDACCCVQDGLQPGLSPREFVFGHLLSRDIAARAE